MGCDFKCVCGAWSERNFAVAWFVALSLEKWRRVCAACEQMACEKLGLEEPHQWGSSARTLRRRAGRSSSAHHQIILSYKGSESVLAHNRLMPASEWVCVYNAVCGAYASCWWVGLHQTIAIIPSELLFIKKKLVSIPPHCHHSDRWLLAPMHACTGEWVGCILACASLPAGMYAMGCWLKLA
jgi:hypothetical protein